MRRSRLTPRHSLLATRTNPRQSRGLQARSKRGPQRRGVLLLVVLSLLVLFMLIGTAWLMSSSQSRSQAVIAARVNRVGNKPGELLDRALREWLRDTERPNSVIRYHSLLRDLCGTDGFQGAIYRPSLTFDPQVPAQQVTRFAGATAGTPQQQLGPTQGQMIDVYVSARDYSAADALDLRHVLKLERNPGGQPEVQALPQSRGYFNGCLLTVTSGPAAGQSTRIVDYEYVGDLARTSTNPVRPHRLYRFRVLAFPRSDGQPLNIDQRAGRVPEIADLAGATFVVNGRAFNGTGLGYNPLAGVGLPRLSALELFQNGSNYIGTELALTPNYAFLDLLKLAAIDPNGASPPPTDPFAMNLTAQNFFLFNTVQGRGPVVYTLGPGDADESYDAADFQNMWLALVTATPRATGRVVQDDSAGPVATELDDPRVINPQGVFVNVDRFLRLDLENVPWPSFHRPDLVNYWYHRLLMLLSDGKPTDAHVRAILQPFQPNGAPTQPLTAQQAALVAAIKRKIMLRPLREDHPNFDGGNPRSVPRDLKDTQQLLVNNNIGIPFWEAVGPWDVDNDNDGVPDSVWVDLGDPVLELEDGTRYRAMYSFLIVDLDSRLNVNAHGLADHINPPSFFFDKRDNDGNGLIDEPGELRDPTNALAGAYDSDSLAQGLGYGPAEISLRPVFPVPWADANGTLDFSANRSELVTQNKGIPVDSYASLLAGRVGLDYSGITGRHGLDPVVADDFVPPPAFPPNQMSFSVAPGVSSVVPGVAVFGPPGVHAQLKFFDYPESIFSFDPTSPSYRATSFSTPPDLNGRYSLGLDHVGQPTYEFTAEQSDRPLVADSPYELDLSSAKRRDTRSDKRSLRLINSPTGAWTTEYVEFANGNPNPIVVSSVPGIVEDSDDAPFATADLERVLRAFDADAGTLPSRLWDVVDSFDPLKLRDFDPNRVTASAIDEFGAAGALERLTAAQQMSAINRRLVTTDSVDLPVPSVTPPAYFFTAPPSVPEAQKPVYEQYVRRNPPKSLIEMLELRIRRSFADASWPPTPFDDYDPAGDHDLDGMPNSADSDWSDSAEVNGRRVRAQRISAITSGGTWTDENNDTHSVSGILAPELIAGQRLDLNRPFGDGTDNDGNGVVDDPLEAGDPFLDRNGNGMWDQGEPFIDVLQNGAGGTTGVCDRPKDQLWAGLVASGTIGEQISFDYTNGHGEPIRAEVAGNAPLAKVRNLESQARQLYARHLYCLMLLMVDEGYAETPNVPSLGGDNINLEFMLESIALRMGNLNAPTDADKDLAKRKLTARRIAQWAINVADFRDADVIMTPFEYDENPWDGWGTTDRDGNLVPLDGDVATNENGSETMSEVAAAAGGQTLAANNMAHVIDWTQVATTRNRVVSINAVTGPPTIQEQTRGVVWGAERPELLITETLAFHDRRCTDDGTVSPKLSDTPQQGEAPDYDLDQRLKPRGSLFVEIYNPWTKDSQPPNELYGRTQLAANQFSDAGVMLNRLSDAGVVAPGVTAANPYQPQTIIKRSPVWRLAVIRDPINGRLSNRVIDLSPSPQYDPTNPRAVELEAERIVNQYGQNIFAQVGEIDADGFAFNSDRDAERIVYFTTNNDPNRTNDDNLENRPGQIGEYNFNVAVGAQPIPVMSNLNVWVPPLPWRRDEITGNPTTINTPAAKRYFIARTDRQPLDANNPSPDDVDLQVAPILPGRYAVVGSSGLQLVGSTAAGFPPYSTPDGQVTQRFVTPTSRAPDGAQEAQSDVAHLTELSRTRRIELWPRVDPGVHQLLVGSNGGPEFVRHVDYPNPINVHDPQLNGNPTAAASRPIDPCVAYPVEDLNISEPVEGYPSHYYQDLYYNHPAQPEAVQKANVQLNASGELEFDVPYDHPLDIEFELVRNGTAQNYRSVHLQRLANPMLPWNPPPFDEAGAPNPLHQPHLPVNPYRTIDAQSVDLTAYNGATTRENELPSGQITTDTGLSGDIETDDITQGDYFAPVSLGEFRFAPDHVLRGLIHVLVTENIRPWLPVDQFRELIKNDPAQVENYLSQLEQRRGNNSQDQTDRNWLTGSASTNRVDQYGRNWSGQRGWSLLRRVLPEDPISGQLQTGDVYTQRPLGHPRSDATYRQRLHLKSLERGSHNSTYYKWPIPASFYSAYRIPQDAPEGWVYDLNFQPRVLWKRERPNVMLFLKSGANEPTTRAFDLKNVLSRRQFLNQFNSDEIRPPRDEQLRNSQIVNTGFQMQKLAFDFLLEQTLGFANDAFVPELDRADGTDAIAMLGQNSPRNGAPEVAVADQAPNKVPVFPPVANVSPPEVEEYEVVPNRPSLLASPQTPTRKGITPADRTFLQNQLTEVRQRMMRSTYPWLAWNNRPFASANELMQVPGASSSMMLRDYSAVSELTPNPYNGSGLIDDGTGNMVSVSAAMRIAIQQAPFGHLLNFLATAAVPAQSSVDQVSGAPHFYRVLEYVQVPSRYVATDTSFTAEIFNDVPVVDDSVNTPGTAIGSNITGPDDPRYFFQPPFNKVSRQRDPGRVNLNTVTGHRELGTGGAPRIWSEVFDGLMHRTQDGNLRNAAGTLMQLGHLGPAWRDVVLSRKGYAQFNADGSTTPLEKTSNDAPPDVFAFGLNPNFPSVISNPFRSPDAGDLVPLPQMVHYGVDASWLRGHHFNPGPGAWGEPGDDNSDGSADDTREAGFGGDMPSYSSATGALLPAASSTDRGIYPLFSESFNAPYFDGERNSYFCYHPLSRLGNLVTNRSNVFAVWITVGYFEVEKAPNWNDADPAVRATVQAHFNNDVTLYNRVYPDGYMLGREVGSDTGNIRRHRGFYIVDRTEPVGFKPGEDLNVENMICLRRRIE